jgi:hypothetical protein
MFTTKRGLALSATLPLALAAFQPQAAAQDRLFGFPAPGRAVTTGTADSASPRDYQGWVFWRSATTGAKTETLPACGAANNGAWIGVIDEKGNAATYNLGIVAASGNVGGSASGVAITSNLGGVILACDGPNSNWNVAAWYAPGANVRAVTGTSDTILASDNGGLVTYNNASAVAVTLPQGGSAGFPDNGFVLMVANYGAGAVTITPTTSTINYAGTVGASAMTLNQGQSAIIALDGSGNYNALVIGASAVTTWLGHGTYSYAKPPYAHAVTFACIGAGGSGASGFAGTSATQYGGAGGAGGVYNEITLPVSSVTWPVTVTVGQGGAAPAGVTSGGGNASNAGGATTFANGGTTYLTCYGGRTSGNYSSAGGATCTNGLGILCPSNADTSGQAGGAPSTGGFAGNGAYSSWGGPGGGAGAGINGSGAGGTGGSGGISAAQTTQAGGVSSGNGPAGSNPPIIALRSLAGSGGAGAGACTTASCTAGAGGAGGYGAGGGGGGACDATSCTSGAGGAGGDGAAIAVAF